MLALTAVWTLALCFARGQVAPAPWLSPPVVDIEAYAKRLEKSGIDLSALMDRIASGDEEALGRLFRLSLSIKAFDDDARAYALILGDTFMKVPKTRGIELYARVLDRQKPEVRQRVRDFLYYPVTIVPEDRHIDGEASIRSLYPTIFPSNYKFGDGDPLFPKKT